MLQSRPHQTKSLSAARRRGTGRRPPAPPTHVQAQPSPLIRTSKRSPPWPCQLPQRPVDSAASKSEPSESSALLGEDGSVVLTTSDAAKTPTAQSPAPLPASPLWKNNSSILGGAGASARSGTSTEASSLVTTTWHSMASALEHEAPATSARQSQRPVNNFGECPMATERPAVEVVSLRRLPSEAAYKAWTTAATFFGHHAAAARCKQYSRRLSKENQCLASASSPLLSRPCQRMISMGSKGASKITS
mmetsp:Transcript_91676/g.263860  ORF Transcript_91676/g.263860 Transcript_91676/m.263860 type:complete len:248 (-) Transcript_91676:219-962(-)